MTPRKWPLMHSNLRKMLDKNGGGQIYDQRQQECCRWTPTGRHEQSCKGSQALRVSESRQGMLRTWHLLTQTLTHYPWSIVDHRLLQKDPHSWQGYYQLGGNWQLKSHRQQRQAVGNQELIYDNQTDRNSSLKIYLSINLFIENKASTKREKHIEGLHNEAIKHISISRYLESQSRSIKIKTWRMLK